MSRTRSPLYLVETDYHTAVNNLAKKSGLEEAIADALMLGSKHHGNDMRDLYKVEGYALDSEHNSYVFRSVPEAAIKTINLANEIAACLREHVCYMVTLTFSPAKLTGRKVRIYVSIPRIYGA